MPIVWIHAKELRRLRNVKRLSHAARAGWMVAGAFVAVLILASLTINDRMQPVQVTVPLRSST